MDDYTDYRSRVSSWTELLNEMIKLNKIDNYLISRDALSITFSINHFSYYLDFDEKFLHQYYRDKVIDRLLDS